MALVKMKIGIGGYRDDEPWPPPGGTIDLPDHEAADIVAAGYGELVDGSRSIDFPGETFRADDSEALTPQRPDDKAKIGDWRAYAEALGLTPAGTKKQLIARIDGHLAAEGADDAATATEDSDAPTGTEPDGAPAENSDQDPADDEDDEPAVQPGRRR